MRLARLAVAALLTGAVAGYALALLRPRRRTTVEPAARPTELAPDRRPRTLDLDAGARAGTPAGRPA